MRLEKLMNYIGQIDDNIITEADIQIENEQLVKRPWAKWVAAVATVCLIVSIPLIQYFTQSTDPLENKDLPGIVVDPIDYPDLPKLIVSMDGGAYGFEGLLAYDISELQNGNPWTTDNVLTTLPVFANPNERDGAGMVIAGLSTEELLEQAENIADLFKLDIISLSTKPTMEEIAIITEKIKQGFGGLDGYEEELRQNTAVYQVMAKCVGATIVVAKSGNIIITLTPETVDLISNIDKLNDYDNFVIEFDYGNGLPLSNDYKFTWDTPNHQARDITEYLLSEYGDFMHITSPGYDLFADYTFSANLTRLNTFVFENSGSAEERILNYNFHRLYFSPTEGGGLGSIKYYNIDLSNKLGDYPIITAEKAHELLYNKSYITSVPYELPDEKYVAHVELMYRTSGFEEMFMPYYRFLIELPTMQHENGLKTFGAFYVPAVEGRYLDNMPVWDGSFN
jgi:hypothetical protein